MFSKKLFLFAIIALFIGAAIAKKQCNPFPKAKPTRILYPADLTPAQLAYHEHYMQIAYDLAVAENNLFTTVIVKDSDGSIACTGLNQAEKSYIFHGETVAISNCSLLHNKNTWEGYSLYTTGESCPMCQAAANWAGFSTVIYGTSIETLYCRKCIGQLPIQSSAINALMFGMPTAAPRSQIIGDILSIKTDTIYPNMCGSGSPWEVRPQCKSCASDDEYDF